MARGVNEEFAPPTINPGAITCRGDRALKTAYQTDSESGKGVAEPYRRDRFRLFFSIMVDQPWRGTSAS